MSYNTDLQGKNARIQALIDTANALPDAGSAPSVEQATPSITVSASGLITASATQGAGNVAAGTKTATKQLTTQAGKTVTPTTSEQTAVNSGVYTTGAVKVAGDANLIPANIKSGVSIFGVAGSLSGGSGPFSKFEVIEYTPTSDTSSFTINHTLGVKPYGLILINKNAEISDEVASILSFIFIPEEHSWICLNYYRSDSTGPGTKTFMTSDTGYMNFTSTFIKFNLGGSATMQMLLGGVDYLMIPFVL